MEKKNKWLPACLALLLAASLAMGMPLKAQACGGGGSMDHGSMDHSSSGNMSQGYGGQGSSGHMGQGQMGPGMMGGSQAPSGTWSQPAAPGNTGSGQIGDTGSVDHSQMGHGGAGR